MPSFGHTLVMGLLEKKPLLSEKRALDFAEFRTHSGHRLADFVLLY
jgi:hypothetical protein